MLVTGGVIGTAGHIDHGKTTLVHALTGIDTDRLKEEKARGITIELGFAHLRLPSGRTVGVVDVPGHERFVRAMVAGAVGVDLIVLVVAADEGVMPQTREHLDICGLLGVSRGVVALTKIDAVEPAMRELAEEDVRAALQRTPLAKATIVLCSARTGEGLPALLQAIDDALTGPVRAGAWPAPPRGPDTLARLPIDRVFTMKGFGTVVTGTLWSGQLAVGDEVELVPAPSVRREKIRGLQVHGGAVELAVAGHRVAVNLPLPRELIERGLVLGHAGALASGRIFDAQIELLASARRPLSRRARLLLHTGTTQVEAAIRLLEGEKLAQGARAYVEIEAKEPLVLLPGDRFVLRGFETQRGHGTTVGGGVVLRVLGTRSRRGKRTEPALLAEHLKALQSGDVEACVRLELERADEAGLDRAALSQRLPFSARNIGAAIERLLTRHEAFRYDRTRDAYIAATSYAALRARAVAAITAFHVAAPLEPGLAREALRATVAEDPRLLHLVVESLIDDRTLVADRDRVRLVDHDPGRAEKARGLDELGARLAELIASAALAPPRGVDLRAALGGGAPPQPEIDRALTVLVRSGQIVRVQELYFDAAVLGTLRNRLVAYLEEHKQILQPAWKDMVGASRKYSIPLAEYFDAEKLTLRVGEGRKLRR